MDKPRLDRQITTRIPEHQVLLTFTHDDDAARFYFWIQKEGWEAFQEAVENGEALPF